MQRIIFACDSFKGTLSSFKVGEAVEVGLKNCFQSHEDSEKSFEGLYSSSILRNRMKFVHCPMSDGGGGLIDSLTYRKDSGRQISPILPSPTFPLTSSESVNVSRTVHPTSVSSVSSCISKVNLQRIQIPLEYPIHGPLGEIITDRPVFFACDVKQRVVLVEMAEAAGLARVGDPARRSPWETSSYGVGDILKYAMKYITRESQSDENRMTPSGVKQGIDTGVSTPIGVTVLLGVGGSATNDGGLGALQSLGLAIYISLASNECSENEAFRLKEPFAGRHLSLLHHVELTPELKSLFSLKKKGNTAPDGNWCVIEEMFLICDVENPLVGNTGATFIFGPQKCSPVVHGSTGVEDAAVGTVKTPAQKEMLFQLEEGMKLAAKRVVASSWSEIIKWHQERELSNAGVVVPQSSTTFLFSTEKTDKMSTEAKIKEIQDHLLYSPRGGGAGGMSGFFRYVLGTSCLPGGDIVAALQGLRVVEKMPWMTASSAASSSRENGGMDMEKLGEKRFPFGLLFDDWDTLVTGEGSFDAQSIYSKKTVGKLLEMVIEANAWRWKMEHTRASTSLKSSTGLFSPNLLKDIIVVCGRTGFRTSQEAMEALKSVLLKKNGNGTSMSPLLRKWIQEISHMISTPPASLEKVLDLLIPRFKILVLTEHFSLEEAMKNPYQCVVEVTKRTFGGDLNWKEGKSHL